MAYVHTIDWTKPANGLKAARSRGKVSTLSRGAWLSDLTALRKSMTLCFRCLSRFDFKAAGYMKAEAAPGWHECVAECDGCRIEGRCTFLKPQER
jgi:hypothetical protein